jgi:hypothetical protein
LPLVVTALQTYSTYDTLADNLPDLAVVAGLRPAIAQHRATALNR